MIVHYRIGGELDYPDDEPPKKSLAPYNKKKDFVHCTILFALVLLTFVYGHYKYAYNCRLEAERNKKVNKKFEVLTPEFKKRKLEEFKRNFRMVSDNINIEI